MATPDACPNCQSVKFDAEVIEEDRWSYNPKSEGHYTVAVGVEFTCSECGHVWEDDTSDDDPDPDDVEDFMTDFKRRNL